jgi:hypothetical protein
MGKNEQTSMEDLLSRRVVDEKERSPDDASSIAESNEPEAFEAREAFTDANQQDQNKAEATPKQESQPKPQAKDDDDSDEGRQRRMSALPKWAHLRMEANNQKADAAVREAEQLKQQLQQLQAQRQPATEQEEQPEEWSDWTTKQINSAKAEMEKQNWDQRNTFGWQLANIKHGEELPREATGWANDKARVDPAFARQVFQAADPVDFCITEFKKAQFAAEAEKFGWDLDKLAAARAAKGQPQTQQTQPQPAAGGQTGAVSQQTEPRMPSDFASANTGAGRVNGDAGPTPLSDLLALNRNRR